MRFPPYIQPVTKQAQLAAVRLGHALPRRFSLASGRFIHEKEDGARGRYHASEHEEQEQPRTPILIHAYLIHA
jgi:hypothetical protein